MIQPFPLRYFPRRNLCPHRHLSTNAHCSFILNNTKMGPLKFHRHVSGFAMVRLHSTVLPFYYLTLWCCKQVSEKANLTERCLAHGFSLAAFGPWQHHGLWHGSPVHLWWPEGKRDRKGL